VNQHDAPVDECEEPTEHGETWARAPACVLSRAVRFL
jgi:hypothetical protein